MKSIVRIFIVCLTLIFSSTAVYSESTGPEPGKLIEGSKFSKELDFSDEPLLEELPKKNLKKLTIIDANRYLSALALIENVLYYYGFDQIGNNELAVISKKSMGSAVAQYLCDLGDVPGRSKEDCFEENGEPLRLIRQNGSPQSMRRIQKAFAKEQIKEETIIHVFEGLGFEVAYELNSPSGQNRSYKDVFNKMMNYVKRGFFVLINVEVVRAKNRPYRYLLVNGYDDEKEQLYYIDLLSRLEEPEKASVYYGQLMDGSGWYGGKWPWLKSFIAVRY